MPVLANGIGKQTVTITYGDYTATFEINVEDYVKEIEITTMPSKVTYQYGEEIDLSGMVVKGVMGSSTPMNKVYGEEITDYTVDAQKANVVGTQVVTVTYGELKTVPRSIIPWYSLEMASSMQTSSRSRSVEPSSNQERRVCDVFIYRQQSD